MKINIEPIKSWFGFSRRERRSTFILLILIIVIISVRFAFPESNTTVDVITLKDEGVKNSQDSAGEVSQVQGLFTFDPNTISNDSLRMLGLSVRTSDIFIRYRSRGGKFRVPSDIKKVYGIDSLTAEKLIPRIEIVSTVMRNTTGTQVQRQTKLIGLNSCDSVTLTGLPGIGPVLASRIIKYRHLLGGFARVEQLKEVYGLPVETYNLIDKRFFADTLLIVKISINDSDYKTLARFPYLEKYDVSGILKFRELKGRISSIGTLTENKLLTVEKAEKLRPYLRFE